MAIKDRQNRILDIVNEKRKLEVGELAGLLSVSQVTIRKDLDALEKKGLLKREHGFACAVNPDDIANRLAFFYDIKRRIAAKAAEIVSDGETVMIESGSSCALLAELLSSEKKDVHIITNSAFIADHVRHIGNNRVTLLGGEYQRESQVCVGALVRICAREFFVDKLFMGTDGFIPEVGFTCGDMARAEAVRALAESAKHRIILTDSSKFNEHGLVLQMRFSEVQQVFTDNRIPDEAAAVLKNQGIGCVTIEA